MVKYKDGNIVCLSLKNFQTYSSVKFKFGPALNLIVGPNGSGKSTIANSLALIFNGTPSTIGKTKDITDFIKFGEKQATIECMLYKKSLFRADKSEDDNNMLNIYENTIKLKRVILVTPDKKTVNTYYIGDKQFSKNEYHRFVQEMSIDCNNLTNYLPQEKVAAFVQLNNKELFTEVYKHISLTQKHMQKTIEDFYKQQQEIEILENEITQNRKKLELIDGNLEILAKEFEKYLKYEENIRRIKILSFKILLMDYEKAKNESKTVKKELLGLLEKKEKMEQEKNEIFEKIEKINKNELFQKYSEVKSQLSNQNESIEKYVEQLFEIFNEFEMIEIEKDKIKKRNQVIAENNEYIRNKKERNEEILVQLEDKYRKQCLLILKNCLDCKKVILLAKDLNLPDNFITQYTEDDISNLRKKLNNNQLIPEDLEYVTPNMNILQRYTKEINYEIENHKRVTEKIQHEIEDLEKEKNKYQVEKQQRMELLKKYHYDTFRAVEYLRKTDIGIKYLEPSFLHIEIDNVYKDEVESLLGFISLTSFLFRNSRDMLVFTKRIKDEMSLAVNVSVVSFGTLNIRGIHRADLNELGIDGTAIDYIKAPQPYINFFIQYYSFHLFPITKKKIEEKITFRKLVNVNKIITNRTYIEIKGNRYNKEKVFRYVKIVTKNIFGNKVIDENSIVEKQQILDQERRSKLKYCESLIYNKTKIDELSNELQQKYSLQETTTIFFSIQKLKVSISEMRESEPVVFDDIKTKNLEKKQEEIECNLANLLAVENIPIIKLDEIKQLELEHKNFLRQFEFNKQSSEELAVQCDKISSKYEKCKEIKNTISNKMKELQKKEDEERPNVIALNNLSMNGSLAAQRNEIRPIDNYLDEMDGLPNESSDLLAEINSLKCSNRVIDPKGTIKKDYSCKENEYDNAQNLIASKEEKKKNKIISYESVKNNLLETFMVYFQPINIRFQKYFRMFDFDGEVKLCFGDKEDIDKVKENTYNNEKSDIAFSPGVFKLNIFVKFRKGDSLQKLSSARQSGGEKSLATILFLLSLYDKGAPFKLVDEINQGMDAVNEKKVFEVIKQMSETSQFFIITPKILPDLSYGDDTQITFLFGGKTAEIINDL